MRGKLFQGTIKTCSESLKTNKKTGFLLMIIRPEVAQDRAAIATLIARIGMEFSIIPLVLNTKARMYLESADKTQLC